MDGRTDGRTDGWMDGWMDGRTDGWMDGWMDGWTDGWMDGWLDGWMFGWIVFSTGSTTPHDKPLKLATQTSFNPPLKNHKDHIWITPSVGHSTQMDFTDLPTYS